MVKRLMIEQESMSFNLGARNTTILNNKNGAIQSAKTINCTKFRNHARENEHELLVVHEKTEVPKRSIVFNRTTQEQQQAKANHNKSSNLMSNNKVFRVYESNANTNTKPTTPPTSVNSSDCLEFNIARDVLTSNVDGQKSFLKLSQQQFHSCDLNPLFNQNKSGTTTPNNINESTYQNLSSTLGLPNTIGTISTTTNYSTGHGTSNNNKSSSFAIDDYSQSILRYFDENYDDFRGQSFSTSSKEGVWLVKSWQEILLRTSFIIPIVLMGIIGNATIIYSICEFKRFRTKPTNLFILNMAIADLLTTIICPTAALFTDIYQFYVLGSFFCTIEGFSKIACLLVSSNSLIVLSVDWLLSVVKPFRTRISIRQSWFSLALIWTLSVLMASPMLHWRRLRSRLWDDVIEVWCSESFNESKYYWVGIQFFLIYLPTLIMTIVLVVILAQMDRFEARMRRARANSVQCVNEDSVTSTNSVNHFSGRGSSSGGAISSSNGSNSNVSMRYRRRIVKILFTYLLTSIICWTPLQFTILYRHFREKGELESWFMELNFFAQLCASLSAAMNPIIFGFLSQPFRHIVTKSWLFKLFSRFCIQKGNETAGRNNHDHNNNNNIDNFALKNLKNLPTNRVGIQNNNRKNNSQHNRSNSQQRITREFSHEQPRLTIGSIETLNYCPTTVNHTRATSNQAPSDKQTSHNKHSINNQMNIHSHRNIKQQTPSGKLQSDDGGCSSQCFQNASASRLDSVIGDTAIINENDRSQHQQQHHYPNPHRHKQVSFDTNLETSSIQLNAIVVAAPATFKPKYRSLGCDNEAYDSKGEENSIIKSMIHYNDDVIQNLQSKAEIQIDPSKLDGGGVSRTSE